MKPPDVEAADLYCLGVLIVRVAPRLSWAVRLGASTRIQRSRPERWERLVVPTALEI